MKYSKYFGEVVKENGIIQFNTLQFQRMMNIIYSEGFINGQKSTFDLTNKITELTGNLEPEMLVMEMISLSKK